MKILLQMIGGLEKIIQVDENQLNFTRKSNVGRVAGEKAEALVNRIFFKVNRILFKVNRIFLIKNKQETTIVYVLFIGSTVWTDEYGAYRNLQNYNFVHDTVCHKYNFITHQVKAVELIIT